MSSLLSHAGFKTHNQWQTSIKFERTARRKYRSSTKHGPLYSEAIVWTISNPQRCVQLGSTDEENCTTPLLTPDEKSTLYSNELHRFQSFQNQLQNQLRSQNNLQTQLFLSFLTTATNSLEAALKKPRYTHTATPKAYFLTPPPTVEHPERHWHTGDTDMDENDSDESESEREHADDTNVDESDPDKSEREYPDDTMWKGLI